VGYEGLEPSWSLRSHSGSKRGDLPAELAARAEDSGDGPAPVRPGRHLRALPWHPLDVPESPFLRFDAFWLVLAALLVTLARLLERLRSRHPEVWEELGRPALLPRRGVGVSAGLTRFYWSRRAAALSDPTLWRWVQLLRALQLMLVAVLVTLWALHLGAAGT